uniref:Uncharacterized protein n=1 Tax=Fagus sylvatica TaxID=28930 RepID=A0A2N9F9J0_FAGSY
MESFLCYFLFIRLCFLLPLVFHAIVTNCFSSVQPLCHDDESSALLQFKESFVINKTASINPLAYPKVSSWKLEGEDRDCCSWDGVECDDGTGHVIGLDLNSSCLFGSMVSNSSLFSLAQLQRLNLADNHFNFSQIPSGLSRLSKLTYLNLSNSEFSGQIPSNISQLSKLSSLDLSSNDMSYHKSLKNLVQNLTNLKVLSLSYVQILSPLPDILANLSCLTTLYLQGCGLYGEFPVGILQLPKLQVLRVSNNQNLKGYLPEFKSSNPLKILSLRITNFSGKLPASIGKLDSLIELDVSFCQLSGSIPSSLGNLTNLIYLDLSDNTFKSSNSSLSWVGRLSKLTFLALGQINWNMEIPLYLANLTQLRCLDLAANQITGQIPSWLANLTQLTVLRLQDNHLQGPIPSSIFELKNLERLNLHSNNLSGTVTVDMFLKFKNLTTLLLSGNNISFLTNTKPNINAALSKFKILGLASCNLRKFPDFLRNQVQLELIDLSSNNIHGQIPKWVWSTSKETLVYVDFSYNFLTGFDQHLGDFPWPRIQILKFYSNKLQMTLPIPPSSTLIYLVGRNMLHGEIPPLICSLSSLRSLDLSSNNFSGTLPHCLGNFSSSLNKLKLRNNSFRGIIPQICSKGSRLRMIDLSQNRFEGLVPRSLSDCRMLEILNLGSNQINDVFPSWLATLPELEVLILRSNGFHGVVGSPKTNFAFPKLHIVDLSANKFTGKLPSEYFRNWKAMEKIDVDDFTYMKSFTLIEFGYFTLLEYSIYSMRIVNKGKETEYPYIIEVFTAIDVSSNEFEGKIPELIGDLNRLQLLNLSNNNLTGHIPLSLRNLTELESLDLSQNKLSGIIPPQLTQLTFLASFNVSYNQLTGPIPHGKQFDTFENNSFIGNSGLCGNPLSKKCENPRASPPPPSSFKKDQDSWFPIEFDWKIIIMGYWSGLVIGVVIGHTLAERQQWFVRNRKRKYRR